MTGPFIGAKTITDKEGVHYMVCPACNHQGCTACGNKGLVRTHPLPLVTSYRLGTYVPLTTAPSHVNHVAPAILDDTADFAALKRRFHVTDLSPVEVSAPSLAL